MPLLFIISSDFHHKLITQECYKNTDFTKVSNIFIKHNLNLLILKPVNLT